MFDLHGRVALVTGAGRGVGAAIATTLAGLGAAVAVNDIDEDRAAPVVAQLTADAPAVSAAADVTDLDAVRRMVASVTEVLGPIDILVNNAGMPTSGVTMSRFAESAPEDWPVMIGLNVYGVMHCAHAVLPSMLERRWGRIVTIVSDAGRIGEPYLAVYAASKAAAAGWSRSVAKEVGPDGVTCNCVSLGTIAGPLAAARSVQAPAEARSEEARAKQARRYPVGRLGAPGDVAAAVAWLVSEEAAWVTGQTVPVNGGYSTS